MLREYLDEVPMAHTPANDAAVYWAWAERIAGGELTQDIPFFSAPLYPYLLGLLRALGGTLTTVYVVQELLSLLTACLLAWVCRDRFGPGVGLLSAGVFLALMEPASFALRVLACSLHLFLVTVTWALLVGVQRKASNWRRVAVGAALGLLCLAYSPALVLVLLVGPWLFWQSARRFADALRAAIPLGVAALVIAPATLHNLRASGNVFFIQALGGVTLRLGNGPGSTGTYTPIPNMSNYRARMLFDAARIYQNETGHPGSWKDVDAYFRDLAFSQWWSDPSRAVQLGMQKLYWFLTGRNYSDQCQPTDEIAVGLADWLGRLAPIPTPWLMGAGLVALLLMLRHPIRYGPEWMLFIVPLSTALLFFYFPRFRLPAVPILTVGAVWVVARAIRWRENWRLSVIVAPVLAASLLLGRVNQAIGFDRPMFRNVAMDLMTKGRLAEAENALRQMSDIGPALQISAWALLRHLQGRTDGAYKLYRKAIELDPEDVFVRAQFGTLLLQLHRWEEALQESTEVLRTRPEELDARYCRAAALSGLERLDEAREEFEHGFRSEPDNRRWAEGLAHVLFCLGNSAEAERLLRDTIDQHGDSVTSQIELSRTLQAAGRASEAADLYGQALASGEVSPGMRLEYGSFLVDAQRWSEAIEQLALGLKEEPDDVTGNLNMGVALGSLGRSAQAERYLQQALDQAPNDVRVLRGLGVCYARQRKYDQAIEVFRKALEIDPTHLKTQSDLQRVLNLRDQE